MNGLQPVNSFGQNAMRCGTPDCAAASPFYGTDTPWLDVAHTEKCLCHRRQPSFPPLSPTCAGVLRKYHKRDISKSEILELAVVSITASKIVPIELAFS